jgi:multidrug efflux pump subunit AcrA (membrane-fusion protein)
MIKLILVPFFIILLLSSCKSKDEMKVQTTIVKKGVFTEELVEEGTLRAVNSINIISPRISYRYGSLKIASMVEDGTEVEKGDTLIIFDPTEIKKAILDTEQRLEIAVAEYDKLLATQNSEIEDLEADLEISRISLEISEINFEQSVYEAEITKKEIQLKLENARLSLARAEEQIENKKKIHKVDQFQKQISLKQLRSQMEEATGTLNNLFVTSPAHGIAITQHNWMSNNKWQAGDQPYSGSKIIELPDLSEMMADVQINEVDALKITTGVPVSIIPDAYSDTVFTGEITWMANLAQNKSYNSKIKVFPIGISIDQTSDKLMPGLTVSCKLKIREIPDVLIIPLESVFKDDLAEYVYLKTGSGFQRQDIVISAYNSDYALIEEGLSENDELALSDPFKDKMDDNEKTNQDVKL